MATKNLLVVATTLRYGVVDGWLLTLSAINYETHVPVCNFKSSYAVRLERSLVHFTIEVM